MNTPQLGDLGYTTVQHRSQIVSITSEKNDNLRIVGLQADNLLIVLGERIQKGTAAVPYNCDDGSMLFRVEYFKTKQYRVFSAWGFGWIDAKFVTR